MLTGFKGVTALAFFEDFFSLRQVGGGEKSNEVDFFFTAIVVAFFDFQRKRQMVIIAVIRLIDQLSEEIQAQISQKRRAYPGYEFVQLHQIALYLVFRATSLALSRFTRIYPLSA